jgi:hypothetical protein
MKKNHKKDLEEHLCVIEQATEDIDIAVDEIRLLLNKKA